MKEHLSYMRNCSKKNKKKRIIIIAICCIILVLLSVLIVYLIKNVFLTNANKENKKLQKKLLSYVEETINEDSGEKEYKIDFKKLKKMNPDTIAYLRVNNTEINNIVVKGNDNSYYLSHNFKKEDNDNTGWIFADCNNKFDFTDYNIVIYGQNAENDSIFGTLRNCLKEEWYSNEENKYITIVTEDSVKKFEIFSIYQENLNDETIQVNFEKDNEFLDFLDKAKAKSIKDFNIELTAERGILTLVAYNNDNSNKIIVHAVNVF